MTEHYLKNIMPDSITGMIFALEGVKNGIVLLNGPMGCKFYHSTTSQFLALRPSLYLPVGEGEEKVPVDYNFLNDWFFRQSRVPCTYLDGYDYVYGTREKVAEGLAYLKEHVDFDLIAIVNSPGASLIGDNLAETVRECMDGQPCVILESPGYSEDFSSGYETAVLELLRQAVKPGRDRKRQIAQDKASAKSVNLLGISIWQRYWEGNLEELKRLFGLCGIEVNCCPGAGSSVEELKKLPEADLNVVIYPELGRRTAEFLKESCGTPYYLCQGPPVGFSATEQMFREICERLGKDDLPVKEDSEKARALAWIKINGVHEMSGLPEGTAFAVEESCSTVYSFAGFFMEYLGMVPDCLSIIGEKDPFIMGKLQKLLSDHEAGHPEEKDIFDTRAELVFGNANTIAALKLRNQAFCGIEISQPGMGYIDVLPKTQLGIKGSLFLVEQVLNGLMSKI